VAEAGFVVAGPLGFTGYLMGKEIGQAADQMLQEFGSTELNAAIDYAMFDSAINQLANMAVANIATQTALSLAELALCQALSIPLTPPELVDVNYDGEAGAYDLMEAAGIAENWCSDPSFNCASTN
jgi:hypothetical protein